GTTGNEIACNDDCIGGGCSGTTQSFLTLPVTLGANYRIRVSGYNGASGAFTLPASLLPPRNDRLPNATQIGEGTYTGTTCGATVDGSSSCANGNSNTTPDIWFAYTPTCSGTIGIDTCGSDYDTVLSVHSGCPGTSGNEITCDDDCVIGGFGC